MMCCWCNPHASLATNRRAETPSTLNNAKPNLSMDVKLVIASGYDVLMPCRVKGLLFGVQGLLLLGLRCWVWGLGFGIQGFRCRLRGPGLKALRCNQANRSL